MKQSRRLFDTPLRPRAKPRVLMHAIDAGSGPSGRVQAKFQCQKCGHTDWMLCSLTEMRRGEPCPKCNKDSK